MNKSRQFTIILLLGTVLLWGAGEVSAKSQPNVYNQVNDAVRAHSEGNLRLAEDLYTRIINSGKLNDDPKILAYLHNNRAVIMMQREEPGRAIMDLDRALELYPEPSAFYNRALLLADSGDKEKALADLNKAIELQPNYGNALERRGRLLLEMGRRAEARDDLEKAKKSRFKIAFLGQGDLMPFEAPAPASGMRVD